MSTNENIETKAQHFGLSTYKINKTSRLAFVWCPSNVKMEEICLHFHEIHFQEFLLSYVA